MKLDRSITRRNHQTSLLPRSSPIPHLQLTLPFLLVRRARARSTRISNRIQGPLLPNPRNLYNLLTTRPTENRHAKGVFRLREAKRGRNLRPRFAPGQRGDLRQTIYGRERGAGLRVVEVDAPIIAATPSGDEAGLPGCEGNGFAGGVDVEEFAFAAGRDGEDLALAGDGVALGCIAIADSDVAGGSVFTPGEELLGIVDEQGVVVSACSERAATPTPGNAADLLRMAGEFGEHGHAAVPVE